jgi:putative selenate reductase
VCPNRANTIVRVPGLRDELQIVHQDALCNECGGCATFCPWDGKPYREKLTVFRLAADFEESTNPGFFLLGERGVLRVQGRRVELFVDASGRARADGADPGALAVVEAIVGQSRWLLGGMP